MAKTLADLALGTVIIDEGTTGNWIVVDQNHKDFPANSTTLMRVSAAPLVAFDGAEKTRPSSNERNTYGNNAYDVSNIRQWLNSDAEAGAWYSPQHGWDSPPSSSNVSKSGYDYDTAAGFMKTYLSENWRAAVLPTVVQSTLSDVDGGGQVYTTDKIFLPSLTELNIDYSQFNYDPREGSVFAYFNTTTNYSTIFKKFITNDTWTRSLSIIQKTYGNGNEVTNTGYLVICLTDGSNYYTTSGAYVGQRIAPCCNLPSTTLVSDSPNDSGYYSIIWNEAPNIPETIAVQGTVFSGEKTYVAWSASTDPEGEVVTYVLERSDNSASYVEVYRGAVNNYADTVPESAETAQWRVKALDAAGNESGYIATEALPVSHNKAPVITGSTGNLGNYSAPFSYPYTVTDPESDAVIVTEAIDGLQLRRHAVVLGEENRMEVEGAAWLRLTAGQHTLTITATDSAGAVSTLTATFTRLVDSLEMTLTEDGIIVCDSQPTRMTIEVSRDLAPGAELMVEVCNNAYDDSPTWETATGAALSGLAHVFTNTTKTAANWGVNIRVTVKRNGTTGNCRIYGIGGNVE